MQLLETMARELRDEGVPVLRETGDQRFKLCIINMIIIIIIEAI